MPATVQPAPAPSNFPIMRTYLQHGLSVIPLSPRSKAPSFKSLPNGRWSLWQERLATDAELRDWESAEPDAGIGIVCGFVSGGDNAYCLTGLDVDDADFSKWIEDTATEALLRRTWTVKTGSGKLHIYLFSKQGNQTTSLTAKSRHAADLRAHGNPQIGSKGSYLAAPPTTHPDTGACYTSLYGGPDSIAVVEDASVIFQQLLTSWSRAYDVNLQSDPRGKTIQPPADDETRTLLQRKLGHEKVPGYIRRAILDGAEPGEGDWPNAPSHSDVDYGVVVQLLRHGFTREDVESVFASFPVGEPCYRNDERADHGWMYLDYTLRKAGNELRIQKEAAGKAQGDNFVVERVVRVDYGEDPQYQITLHFTDSGKTASAVMRSEDITSERLFQNAAIKATSELPVMPMQFRGKGFFMFTQLLTKMTEREGVPLEATGQGHLLAKMLEIMQREMLDFRPVDRSELRMGWYDDNTSSAFVLGGTLITRVTMAIRPAPRPENVWQVLRALGGSEKTVVFNGTRERMWSLPLGQLREAMGADSLTRRASLRIAGQTDDG